MKTIIISILLSGIFATLSAQNNIFNRLERETKKRVDKNIDKGIDKGLDAVEEGVEDAIKGETEETEATKEPEKNDKEEVSQNPATEESSNEAITTDTKDEEPPKLVWSKFDFVPGDKVIFEDNIEFEENGEFPSRWDMASGSVEIANFGGEDVIMLRGGNPTIIPYLKNSKTDYLPEVFTIEFDLYLPDNVVFNLYFYDRKNQRCPSGMPDLTIWPKTMELYPAKSSIPDGGDIRKKWAHISIAFTNGKMKAYIDETRLINIPHFEYNPSGISINAYHANDNRPYYIKNIRIAEGGVKYYDRVLQDGKIVSNGIRFDVGKATLRPESMGVINKIHKLMLDHPELNFSVHGHTDSDGSEDSNLKLSEERARTVMNTLVEMGISKDRLNSKGFGESEPVDTNGTPEGKANNRRVEFVKI
jgi:outer membrane protein OmpA-like peptidoglycan-associated protein